MSYIVPCDGIMSVYQVEGAGVQNVIYDVWTRCTFRPLRGGAPPLWPCPLASLGGFKWYAPRRLAPWPGGPRRVPRPRPPRRPFGRRGPVSGVGVARWPLALRRRFASPRCSGRDGARRAWAAPCPGPGSPGAFGVAACRASASGGGARAPGAGFVSGFLLRAAWRSGPGSCPAAVCARAVVACALAALLGAGSPRALRPGPARSSGAASVGGPGARLFRRRGRAPWGVPPAAAGGVAALRAAVAGVAQRSDYLPRPSPA